MNDKEMVERYIYEVTRRIPQNMRKEVGLELQELIEDMISQEGGTMEAVLQKLGDPEEFARKYKDGPNYLIGPQYYENYIWVLKIALIGIVISAVISAIVQGISNLADWTKFFTAFFGEFITTAVNGAYSMVGIITIIFAVLEWNKVKVALKPETKWNVGELRKNSVNVKSWRPDLLPPIPDKRAVISRVDSMFSIIFITVFVALLIFVPQVFGAFHYDGEKVESIACVFNLDEWHRIVPLFVFSLLVSMIDEIIRLVTGYYCKAVMYSSIVCGMIQIGCSIVLIKVLPLWNLNFVKQLQEYTGVDRLSDGDILRFWGTETFNNGFLAFICMITVIEIAVAVYKTFRYSK